MFSPNIARGCSYSSLECRTRHPVYSRRDIDRSRRRRRMNIALRPGASRMNRRRQDEGSKHSCSDDCTDFECCLGCYTHRDSSDFLEGVALSSVDQHAPPLMRVRMVCGHKNVASRSFSQCEYKLQSMLDTTTCFRYTRWQIRTTDWLVSKCFVAAHTAWVASPPLYRRSQGVPLLYNS